MNEELFDELGFGDDDDDTPEPTALATVNVMQAEIMDEDDDTVLPMSYTEAIEELRLVHKEKASIKSRLLNLHDRKGWKALGYGSWVAFVRKEFDEDDRTITNWLIHARVVKDLTRYQQNESGNNFPNEKETRGFSAPVSQAQALVLNKLATPELRRQALKQVKQEAITKTYKGRASQHNGKVTTTLIQEVVQKMLPGGKKPAAAPTKPKLPKNAPVVGNEVMLFSPPEEEAAPPMPETETPAAAAGPLRMVQLIGVRWAPLDAERCGVLLITFHDPLCGYDGCVAVRKESLSE